MVNSISGKYGSPTKIPLEIDSATNVRYDVKQKLVAWWEDSQYSFKVGRSSFSGEFLLVVYFKLLNTQGQVALSKRVKLKQQQDLTIEVKRHEWYSHDLE